MATTQEIETQAQLVEVLAREADGIKKLIDSVAAINTFEVICFVKKDRLQNLIQELQAGEELLNGDPLHQGLLIVNIENQPVLVSATQIDAVGDHLKGVFLPNAFTAKKAEVVTEKTTLNGMNYD